MLTSTVLLTFTEEVALHVLSISFIRVFFKFSTYVLCNASVSATEPSF